MLRDLSLEGNEKEKMGGGKKRLLGNRHEMTFIQVGVSFTQIHDLKSLVFWSRWPDGGI